MIKQNKILKLGESSFLDLLLLSSFLGWEAFLEIANDLGLAWWARIETTEPSTTYFFGPFITRSKLEEKLSVFLDDLGNEESKVMDQKLFQAKCHEPFTLLSMKKT